MDACVYWLDVVDYGVCIDVAIFRYFEEVSNCSCI